MVHVLILIAGVSIYLHESIVGDAEPAAAVGGAIVLVSLLACWATAAAVIGWCGRRLDRTGSYRAVLRAERAAAWARIGSTAVFVAGVMFSGWLTAVRGVVGDLVLVDEALAILPLVGVFCLTWWSLYPIERRLREAVLLRDLDSGSVVFAFVSRAQYVLNAVRHQLLIVLAPLLLIMGWVELVDRLARFGPGWAREALSHPLTFVGVTVWGVAMIFVFSPLLLRRIWKTTPLGAGALRSRIEAMCDRHGVRIGQLLVWRTHGSLTNAAVMGIWGRFRYVLLTDSLLEHLEPDQVEAVAAHEIAHVRRRHIPWLAGIILSLISLVSVPFGRLAVWWFGPQAAEGWAGAAVVMLAIATAFWGFGFISRRFEWQADAFAAQHMSGWSSRGESESVAITPEAASAMIGALERVAHFNGVAVQRPGWRHGSIAERQDRLRELVGRTANSLPIDRQVRWIKRFAVVGFVIAAVLMWWNVQQEGGGASGPGGPQSVRE
ncbi:MAG: M48 family metalloprotease [Phycisphaeraceae bacterium]|nr:M48 family metalloprotease [Phycisphaeraceae bacterium]